MSHIKHKIIVSLNLILLFLWTVFVSGCSGIYTQDLAPQNIYKTSIDVSNTSETNIGLASRSVVSIISSGTLKSQTGSSLRVVSVLSGIIFNSEGYIIAKSESAYMQIYKNEILYTGKASSVYAVLADSFNDSTKYKLNLISYDSNIGLAIFKFYDNFYYYSDGNKSAAKPGFQFYSQPSDFTVKTGDPCFSVGNFLGNAINESAISANLVSKIQICIMSGSISDNESDPEIFEPLFYNNQSFNYVIVSAPINFDMYGGALFNKEGQLIGMNASKVLSDSKNPESQSYFERVALAYPSGLLNIYTETILNNLSSKDN